MNNHAVTHYAHRANSDGSFDSICRACFATVASVRVEVGLTHYERNHVCNPLWSHLVSKCRSASTSLHGKQLPKGNRIFADAIVDWWDTHAHA